MFSWLLKALCTVTPAFSLLSALQEADVVGSLDRGVVTLMEHSDDEQLLTTVALPAGSSSEACFKMVLILYFTQGEVGWDDPSKARSYLIWML